MMEDFYPSHVIGQLNLSEEEFWEYKALEFRDWTGDSWSNDAILPRFSFICLYWHVELRMLVLKVTLWQEFNPLPDDKF